MPIYRNCPYCRFALSSPSSFCPNCGKPLSQNPLETSFFKQAMIYLVSFFLPPLGLFWGFKYLREDDKKAKRIGLIAIFLTIISLVLTLWLSKILVNNFTKSLKEQTEIPDLI